MHWRIWLNPSSVMAGRDPGIHRLGQAGLAVRLPARTRSGRLDRRCDRAEFQQRGEFWQDLAHGR
jgi:hypothetical protein